MCVTVCSCFSLVNPNTKGNKVNKCVVQNTIVQPFARYNSERAKGLYDCDHFKVALF